MINLSDFDCGFMTRYEATARSNDFGFCASRMAVFSSVGKKNDGFSASISSFRREKTRFLRSNFSAVLVVLMVPQIAERVPKSAPFRKIARKRD